MSESVLLFPSLVPLFAQTTSNAALYTFVLYTAAVFVVAGFSNKLLQSRSFVSEYFLGSRGLGMWAFALTFAATSASGGSFTGFPSLVYTYGWIVALWIASYMVVPICAMGLLGKRLNHVARISGSITVPDVARDRFHSPGLGVLSMSLIIFFMTVNLVAQFKAGAVILQSLLRDVEIFQSLATIPLFEGVNSQYLVCLLLFAVSVIVYTTYGGFHAVVWTDVLQGFVMVAGVLIMLPLAISQAGGLESASRQLAEMTPPRTGTIKVALTEPAKNAMVIPAGTWLVMPSDRYLDEFQQWKGPEQQRLAQALQRGELTQGQYQRLEQALEKRDDEIKQGPPYRLFRVVHQSVIAQGQTAPRARNGEGQLIEAAIDAVELTTPAQIVDQLEKQRDHALRAAQAQLVDVDNDLAALDSSANEQREQLLRRKEHLNERIAALESKERFHENPLLLNYPFVVSQPQMRDYVTGAHEKGHYVSGPGPHSTEVLGFLPLSLAVSFFFMWAISGAGQPASMVRLMAFKNSITLRRSIFTVAIYYSLIYFPLVVIFVCARVLLPGMEGSADQIMPDAAVFLTHQIGHGWLAGILLAAPFAAVMSTVDSFLLLTSSALVRDVYQRNINPNASEKTIKRLSYLATLLVGTGAAVGAINPPEFLQNIIVYCGSGVAACFLGPIFFAIYWPRTTKQGAILGMLAGFGTHLAMYVLGYFINGSLSRPIWLLGFDPVLVGLAASFLTVWVVSLITPKPPEELVRKYFYKNDDNPAAAQT